MIYNYSLEELEEYLEKIGEKKFRAKQIFEWLYKKKVNTFDEMTNLSQKLIEKLKNDFKIDNMTLKNVMESQDKSTKKYLFTLEDSENIETVLMSYEWGNSICVSSQVGCNMACSFCASGLAKKVRDLSAGEIIGQILKVEKLENIRISNVVIMGIGEPFENYNNVVKAIKLMYGAKSLEIAQRKITVSTSGLPKMIRKFAEEKNQVNLAISLHAPNNTLRTKLMPINKAHDLNELIDAVKYYIEMTNRRVTFEYIMLEDVNDSEKKAHELSDLIRGLNAYVNLIMYNEVAEFDYKRSKKHKILAFYDTLKKRGINVTIREEKGSDIFAACGQLRRNKS